ncbi:glycine zipper family protein [Thaumasiovibrio sp. DFM-14]|uniref:glycine zipper family protein n=1 Tax=Thaumasiovibrio sp. DFM-14 TaxID=3384792 RepID=UPI0039A0F813
MLKNTVLLSAVLLAGCAYNQAPVIGPHDKSAEEFQHDMQECEFYAQHVDKGEAAKTSAINAGVAGAALGAVEGLLIGESGGAAAVGAVAGGTIGAAAGAGAGAMKATNDQAYVLRNCLQSKGYDVYDLRK